MLDVAAAITTSGVFDCVAIGAVASAVLWLEELRKWRAA